MKKLFQNILLGVALVSVPLTLCGAVIDSYFQISNYGVIGSASGFASSTSYNLAVGFNHLFSNTSSSAALGYSLQNYNSYSTVVGKYNTPTSNALFIVGNGSGSGGTPRTNALEVMTDGTLNIPVAPANARVTIGTTATPGARTTTKIYGTADIDRVPAKGGISMGSFLAQ